MQLLADTKFHELGEKSMGYISACCPPWGAFWCWCTVQSGEMKVGALSVLSIHCTSCEQSSEIIKVKEFGEI
jgi:hypothetical protein